MGKVKAMKTAEDEAFEELERAEMWRKRQIEERMAQPEQEPVALQMDVIVVNLVREGINKHRARELAEHFIKHTTPPQRTWVGLTPDDFRQLEKETTVNGYNGDYCPTWDLIEAVEEKLKEKNT